MNANRPKSKYIFTKPIPLITITKIITIFYFPFKENFVGYPESHDFWEFVYVDRGSIDHRLGDEYYPMNQGDYVIIPLNEVHQLRARPNNTPNVFIISFVSHSKAMKMLHNRVSHLPEHLKHYIADIAGEARQNSIPNNNPNPNNLLTLLSKGDELPGGQQMVKTYLEQLMIQLYRIDNVSEEAPSDLLLPQIEVDNDTVNRMQKYIHDNVYRPISAKNVCEYIGYSNAYLTTLMKKHCNVSIVEYINNVKISEARKLIRRGVSNFSEISNMLCYTDPHYFSRVFRKISGMSPSEYRKSILP